VHRPLADARALAPLDAGTVLTMWSVAPGVMTSIAVAAVLYARGWRRLRRRGCGRVGWPHLTAFMVGLLSLLVALAGPLDVLADRSLAFHMAQHLALLAVAPPLLLLGAPLVPMVAGLPGGRARTLLGRVAVWLERRLGRPLVGLFAISVATWGWHAPQAFELARRHAAWHAAEHLTFVAAGLLFWWPVVRPWPFAPRPPYWATVAALLLADVQNTALSALLVFSGRVYYPSHGTDARALDAQIVAGLLMWVPMSLVYLAPAAVLMVRWLSPRSSAQVGGKRLAAAASSRKSARVAARVASATGSRDAGDSSASRTAAAFSSPNAATHTSGAPDSATSVSVSRRGGGFGESVIGSTVRVGSSSARWPGKSEQT
jgi:cytochrome c oxidase assembly factor CtaG